MRGWITCPAPRLYAVTNKYSYQGATPETDAFLDIAYLISGKKQGDDPDL